MNFANYVAICKENGLIEDKNQHNVKKILTEKIEDLHKLAKALLIYETLSGDEIKDLILKNIQPQRKDEKEEKGEKGEEGGEKGLGRAFQVEGGQGQEGGGGRRWGQQKHPPDDFSALARPPRESPAVTGTCPLTRTRPKCSCGRVAPEFGPRCRKSSQRRIHCSTGTFKAAVST